MTNEKFYTIVEFDDGLQVIPTDWLNESVMKAVWPNFTNYKRYDKAVMLMEVPKSTWTKHPVRKIYGTYSNYAVAKKKLKTAEKLLSHLNSHLNSDTEKEEYLKKTKKIRAAKIMDTLTSSDEELSDDTVHIAKKLKITKDAQKDFNYIHNAERANTMENTTTLCSYVKRERKNEAHSQCNLTFVNIEDIHSRNNDNDNNKDPLSISSMNFNEKRDPQCSKNLAIEEENSDNENNSNDSFADFEQKSDNFQRFVIQKLINLERKLNRLENNINTYQKIIFQKLAISNIEVENKENIDIFDNLPLKNENDLQIMETKLKDDSCYRNQMIKQLTRITCENIRTSCIRLVKAVVSNELALNYSWYGAKKKQVFSRLEICKVIMSVMRKLHTNVTDEEIAAPIKRWLVHAKERIMKNHKETNDIH